MREHRPMAKKDKTRLPRRPTMNTAGLTGASGYRHHAHYRTLLHRNGDVRPPKAKDHQAGSLNERIAARTTRLIGTMACVYVLIVFMAVWIGAHMLRLAHFDPYPFLLLLFIGNIFQLLMMPLLMVGQSVLSKASDARSEQTFKDAEAILHESTEVQQHLFAQDKVLDGQVKQMADLIAAWEQRYGDADTASDALVNAVSTRLVEMATQAARTQQQEPPPPISITGT